MGEGHLHHGITLEATRLSAVNAAANNSPLLTAAIARIPMSARDKVLTELVNEPAVIAMFNR
jgi:hypothetical protein